MGGVCTGLGVAVLVSVGIDVGVAVGVLVGDGIDVGVVVGVSVGVGVEIGASAVNLTIPFSAAGVWMAEIPGVGATLPQATKITLNKTSTVAFLTPLCPS